MKPIPLIALGSFSFALAGAGFAGSVMLTTPPQGTYAPAGVPRVYTYPEPDWERLQNLMPLSMGPAEQWLEWDRAVRFELRAIGKVAGVPVALVDVDGVPTLVVEGTKFWIETRCVAIRVGAGTIEIERASGKHQVLALHASRPVEFPSLDAATAANKARLIDRAAAERDYRGVLLKWSLWSPEEKQAYLLAQLGNGRLVQVRNTPNGVVISGRNLLAGEVGRVRHQREKLFVKSLSSEQRATFEHAKSVVKSGGPSEKAVEAANSSLRDFVIHLTPEQRKLFDAWVGNS